MPKHIHDELLVFLERFLPSFLLEKPHFELFDAFEIFREPILRLDRDFLVILLRGRLPGMVKALGIGDSGVFYLFSDCVGADEFAAAVLL